MESNMEEAKSKSRKRRDLSETATRSSRQRLNGNGHFGPFSLPVKDLRTHRVLPSLSTGDFGEVDDSAVAEKVFGSNVVGRLGQDHGLFDQYEVVDKCVQTTPPDDVLAKSEIVDGLKKTFVSPGKGSCRQVVGRRSPGSISLKVCSRTKLFGNPSSFSYRRLLPYLMDITKGALKSLEMKPQLPMNTRNSVVESSVSRLESNVGDGTGLSPQSRGLIPFKISEPIICTENTADTAVPINSSLTDREVSEAGEVTEVLCDMDESGKGEDYFETVSTKSMIDSDSVDSATHHSPAENISPGLGHVTAVETDDDKYEEPHGSICEKNALEDGQETPFGDKISSSKDVLGTASCALKPIIPNKRNSDHEQLVSEANCCSSVEAISGSSSVGSGTQLSPGKNRGEQTNVFGDSLSCKHLHLGDTHDAKENFVNLEEPQSTLSSKSNADIVHTTLVMNEDIGSKDNTETGKWKSVSKLENNLDDGVITNMENSVGEHINDSTDNKQSPSKRKLHSKPRRLKKFKNYNSVSYRKLLPYLTEIYGDIAGSSNKEEIKINAAQPIVGDLMKKGHPTSVNGTALPGDSNPISAAYCVVEPQMENFDCVSEQHASPVESHLKNGLKLLNDLPGNSHVQGQAIQGPQPSRGPNNMHIVQCVTKSQCTASNFKEEDLPMSSKKNSNLSNLVPVCPEPISPNRRSFVSPTKGILKKSPKGCRGLCTCLKCASFRLHAEKTFEFSRTQLLDSEEIALELINELSVLRSFLKKSVDADRWETSQVQEACYKAHAVEQRAKARFEQMNHDLRIHCQIPKLQRPSVSFARNTEQKNIQI